MEYSLFNFYHFRDVTVMKSDGSYSQRDLNETGTHEKLMQIAKQSVQPLEEKIQSQTADNEKLTEKI